MQPTIAQILEQRRYDQTVTPPAEQVVFTIEGKTIGTLQNFVCISGLPKAGKSTFSGAAVASAFGPGDMFGIKLQLPAERRRIAYFDTEQSDYDFHKHMTRIKNFAGLNGLPAWFDAFKCREDNSATIRQLVETYLQQNKDCSVLIADGFLDLLANFNDEMQSKDLIDWLKRITKQANILLVGVLHLGKKDGHTLGHLGSMVDRYCQSLLKVEKDKEAGVYTLSAEMLRSAADDINPISLQNISGQWQQAHVPKKEEKQQAKIVTIDLHKIHLQQIFTHVNSMDYKTLTTAIGEQYACGTNKAKQIVTDLKTKNLIRKNSNDLYEQTTTNNDGGGRFFVEK
jgi:ferritin